ncbi:MAG: VWA domain-containing protein, partial [Verrucomicrobiota bacterium]
MNASLNRLSRMQTNRFLNSASKPLAAVLAVAFTFFLSGFLSLEAQESPSKVMVVLDASGSMWGEIDGEPKIEIARETIADILSDWTDDRHIGLMAYGHREKGSCEDIEVLIPAAPLDRAAFLKTVNSIIPKGKTPLTDAVQQAAEELKYTEAAASVILVSDGEENCGKDPREVAKMLEANGIEFTAHVIGFDVTEEQQESLAAIAEETGGAFVAADDAASLKLALTQVVAILEKAAEPEPEPKPMPMPVEPAATIGSVNFVATASEGGEEVKAYYSVYEAKADLEGRRKLVKSGTFTKLEELDP